MIVSFTMPLRTVSALNAREHWGKRSRRVKAERAMTAGHLLLYGRAARTWWGAHAATMVVTLTRIGPRLLDSGDNLPSGLKGVRDQIAQWLGVDDRDPCVTWVYAQEKGKWGVHVEIREVKP